MKTKSVVLFILFMMAFCMLIAIVPTQQNTPGSIDKFIEGWNKKAQHIAAEGLAPEFYFQDYSPEISSMILGKVFPNIQYKFRAYLVTNSIKDGSETKYSVILVTDMGADEVYFWTNGNGKITHTSLFDFKAQQAKTNLNLLRNKYSDIAITVHKGIILLDGEIDGIKGSFILDNGSATMELNRKYFEDKLTDVIVCDPESEVKVGLMRAKKFVWGAGTYLSMNLTTGDFSTWETELGMPILGSIGLNELSAFETKIDYNQSRIELFLLNDKGEYMEPERCSKPVVQCKFSMGAMLPVVKAKIGGKSMKVAIDLGLQANLVDVKHLPKLQKVISQSSEQATPGIDNRVVPMQTGVLSKNTIGKHDGGEMRFAFCDLSELKSKPKVDGVLGYAYLSKAPFSINYRKMTIAFY
ncbi:MAG: hypothetical protein CVU48_10485 [Candidatus Cloacimonetes bacterium HGW-Cloacimonetes-1]|jgi:hypothetical protein|nr:MAG: hypothetical protein CVU48_10485 [Candidatus Cloacimonetes bacterium HGW-Cloacimonetes-1]